MGLISFLQLALGWKSFLEKTHIPEDAALRAINSVVAVMEGGEVKVIPNQEGSRLTPSVVAFTDKGERLVGDLARRQAALNPKRTIYSIKRFMGRRHNEVQAEEKLVPYKIVGGPNELVKVEVDGKTYTPPEISAMILRKLKEAAEAYLGHRVSKAVITVNLVTLYASRCADQTYASRPLCPSWLILQRACTT
jgi:hypothetical protein